MHPQKGRRSFLVSGSGDVADAGVTLLDKGESDTLASGEGDLGVLAGTDGEDVRKTGGEVVAGGVLNVGDLVRTGVVLDVLEDSNTTDVVTASAED